MIKFKPIHQHLMIKATFAKGPTEAEEGKKMLRQLVYAVGMVPVTEPQTVYVDYPGNEGLTGSINLATSHIAYHIWDDQKLLMLDLYSCKSFDVMTVLEVLDSFFDDLDVDLRMFDRLTWGAITED